MLIIEAVLEVAGVVLTVLRLVRWLGGRLA